MHNFDLCLRTYILLTRSSDSIFRDKNGFKLGLFISDINYYFFFFRIVRNSDLKGSYIDCVKLCNLSKSKYNQYVCMNKIKYFSPSLI